MADINSTMKLRTPLILPLEFKNNFPQEPKPHALFLFLSYGPNVSSCFSQILVPLTLLITDNYTYTKISWPLFIDPKVTKT